MRFLIDNDFGSKTAFHSFLRGMSMRALHIDCFSGISGDMMLGALLDLGVPESIVRDALDSLKLPGKLRIERIRKGGFASVKVAVDTPHEHAHRHLSHILKMIDQGTMTDGARDLARRMFQTLGDAEAHSHGIPVEKVHFHEVGAVDSIFDFVGIAVALDWLKVDRVTCSSVPTGFGFVQCDHGRLPIPAPAVAHLLTGIPRANVSIEAELTTPTGAAVVRTIVHEFTPLSDITIEKVGLGAGTKDFPEQPNVLRLMLGVASAEREVLASHDSVWLLETNIDNLSGEILGYTLDRLLEIGALDVFTVPIQMKKGRPAVIISVLCDEEHRPAIERTLLEETGTLGVRRSRRERTKLFREKMEVSTPWGVLGGKIGWNDSVKVFTPEFEDCARVARQEGIPLRTVYDAVRQAYELARSSKTKSSDT